MNDDASQPTQPATQQKLDVRRTGHSTSGLSEVDVSDVLCILHPSSPAAFKIVVDTAQKNPQHILQNGGLYLESGRFEHATQELDTFRYNSFERDRAQDLALRFSSRVIDPVIGFCFGRNELRCDINLDCKNLQKRVSNMHFRIFVNASGVLMVEDFSTNGTVVDDITLGGRKRSVQNHKTRMLTSGSVIQVLADSPDDVIKFVVKIPARDSRREEFAARLNQYLEHQRIAEQRAALARHAGAIPEGAARGMLAAPLAGPPNTRQIPTVHALGYNNIYGMRWDGGHQFNCIGVLGKGAFATVYQVATRMHGELFAAKELEKRRVMKNGIMDQRIDNEMQIMKALGHDNIVKYIDYYETDHHLYIIMEYIPCGDLTGYMNSHGTLPEPQAKDMTRQVLSALNYLHHKNITHRDIKPDNILIASEDPFVCKLTDFGLSKVVKNNETFLKTFCGTLLYCAPEVFPHYDQYIAGRRPKRRRPNQQQGPDSSRSYSQLVDIWSYAAVLWYVLCGKPPYEGVVDNTGRGMFNKIMETPLDISPLQGYGISAPCIDLLLRMLNVDPQVRPSERDCLRHPWLNNGALLPSDPSENLLSVIEEGEEDELDASQLSLNDELDGEDLVLNGLRDSSSGEFLQGPSKRHRVDGRDEGCISWHEAVASAQRSQHSIPIVYDAPTPPQQTTEQKRPAKLFGEISQSAIANLQQNFDVSTPPLLKREENSKENSAHSVNVSPSAARERRLAEQLSAKSQAERSSLLGTESILRGMKMVSPGSSGHVPHGTKEIVRPLTPEITHSPPLPHSASTPKAGEPVSMQDVTPKAKPKPFNRQIDIQVPPAYFYDSADPSTHCIEYASKVSGLDFTKPQMLSDLKNASIADTAAVSLQSAGSRAAGHSNTNEQHNQSPSMTSIPDFSRDGGSARAISSTKNATVQVPLLGRLVSTPASFKEVTLDLAQSRVTWGRYAQNTIVFPDVQDTRIPKIGLELWLYSRRLEEAGIVPGIDPVDWANVDDLTCVVRTFSRSGVFINGVRLTEKDERGRLAFGKLHTGDEVTVWQDNREGVVMKLICEFYYGRSARPRQEDDAFVMSTTSQTSTSSQ